MRVFRVLMAVVCFVGAVLVTAGSEPEAIKSVSAAGGKLQFDKVGKKRVVGSASLKGAKITDPIMKDLLEFPSLTRVDLRDAPNVTATGIADLARVKKLQTLELQGAVVSDDAAKALAVATGLTELKLSEGGLTDDGVKDFAALTKLQSLTLLKNAKIRGTTVPALVTLKELTNLSVSGCTLGDLAGWSALKKLPKLTNLSLTSAEVTDAGLKELGQVAQLTSITLDGSPITDAGLHELVRMKALQRLSVLDTKITEKAVPILSEMKQLTYLNVSEKQIGKDGAEALKKALPKCDVDVVK
jgi:Leucine-rich repeat (LRR) protein